MQLLQLTRQIVATSLLVPAFVFADIGNIFEQTGWYDPDDLFPNLPKEYDLILVDGPGGRWGRGGFYKHIDNFNTDVPMIFDDIHRTQDSDVMEYISEHIGREYETIDLYTGVIYGS